MEGVNSSAAKLLNGVFVPQSEDRTVLSETLPNGLKALFISDPKTDMAAAALGCGVGSLDDEDDLPGEAHFTGMFRCRSFRYLARFVAPPHFCHFVEHLLFMGSTAFPDENEYSVFLSDHGGSSNAYTAVSRPPFSSLAVAFPHCSIFFLHSRSYLVTYLFCITPE